MLSRVAESIFWMSRYIERAENVARFIDVNWHLVLDSGTTEEEQWHALVNTTGDDAVFTKKFGAATRENVIQFLTFDRTNLNSIISCVRAARENARSVRDVISSEMWEQINTFYLMLNDAASNNKAVESPYEFFSQVKMSSHLFLGVTDTTMSHGEGWNFCRLGHLLERCDKTSRILDVKYYMLRSKSGDTDEIQWAAVLKSASGLEMFRKRHRRIIPDRVVEFLLFDPDFPRAALHCLKTANEALHAITGTPLGESTCPVEARMQEVCAEIQATSTENVLKMGLHQYVDSLQTKLNHIGDEIHHAFFASKQTVEEAQAAAPKGQSQTQTQTQG